MNEQKRGKNFKIYGFRMIACAMVSWAAFSFYTTDSFQVFVPALAEFRNVEYAKLLTWNTYGNILGCLLTLGAGVVVDRCGVKRTMFAASVIAGLNYMFLPVYPAALLGTGIAVNTCMQVFYCSMPVAVLMGRWYPRKNASVMGIVTGAIVVGSLILLPLFNQSIGSMGIQKAMLLFGAPMVLYGVACLFWIKESPAEVGLEPDGYPMTEEEQKRIIEKKSEKSPWTIGRVLANRAMLFTSVGWGIEMMALVGFSVVAVPCMVSKGLEQSVAVGFASMAGVLSLVGSVCSGVIGERVGMRRTNIGFVLLQAVGCFLVAAANETIVFVAIVGYAMLMLIKGAPNNLITTTILELSGARYYNSVYRIMFTVIMLFRAFGSQIVSISLKLTGGYEEALYIFGGICVVSSVMLWIGGKGYQMPPESAESYIIRTINRSRGEEKKDDI